MRVILTRSKRTTPPAATHHCRKCLYQLDGAVSPVCPECATAFNLQQPATFVVGPLQPPHIRRALRAPGWIFHFLLATSIATYVVLTARIEWWSRTAALAFGLCVMLLLWWLLRALIAFPIRVRHGRNRATRRLAFIAWLIAPAAAALLCLCVLYDLPLRARVALSAPWLQSKSGDIHGRSLTNEAANHGLFYITQTARTASGIWFGLAQPKSATKPLYLVHVDRTDSVKDWERFGFWPAMGDWHLYPAESLTLTSKIAQQPIQHISTAWWDVVRSGEKTTTLPIPTRPPTPWFAMGGPTTAPARNATFRWFFRESGLDHLWLTPLGGSPYWHAAPLPADRWLLRPRRRTF